MAHGSGAVRRNVLGGIIVPVVAPRTGVDAPRGCLELNLQWCLRY